MKRIWLLLFLMTASYFEIKAQQIQGAWKRDLDTAVQVLTIVDNYFAVVTFDMAGKRFISTRGGTAFLEKGIMKGNIEFNTADKSEVGSVYSYSYGMKDRQFQLPIYGLEKGWQKLDDASDALAGNWKIIGREQDGKMVEMKPGSRKTIKILSGTRFQWAAINSETGDFFGTGGGHYSFENGRYTEHIEFFSRDASRVGASLSFDAALKNGDWHHSGLSSKGDRIYEVWTRK